MIPDNPNGMGQRAESSAEKKPKFCLGISQYFHKKLDLVQKTALNDQMIPLKDKATLKIGRG